jgi:hypothetical protein
MSLLDVVIEFLGWKVDEQARAEMSEAELQERAKTTKRWLIAIAAILLVVPIGMAVYFRFF